jgi:hypothetical protein
MDEVLLENFRGLVHHMLAHDHKKLSSLEGSDLSMSEIVFYYLNDSSHLLMIVRELDQDWRKSSRCCRVDGIDAVLTKLEEHRQELLVNSLDVEQGHIVSKVFCEQLLSAPVITRIIERLQNVLDVPLSLLRWNLFKEDVKVLDGANPDIGVV